MSRRGRPGKYSDPNPILVTSNDMPAVAPTQLAHAAARIVLEREETLAPERIAEADARIESAERFDPEEAKQALETAADSLQCLNAANFKELASYARPPRAVRALGMAPCARAWPCLHARAPRFSSRAWD